MEAVILRYVVKETSAFTSVSAVLTMMEKCLSNVRLIHKFLPLWQQPQVAPGRMLTRKIFVMLKAKLADAQNQAVKGVCLGNSQR